MSNKWCAFQRASYSERMCPALAAPGEDYCPAHLAFFRGARVATTPRRRHEPESDADRLPWTPEDWDNILLLRQA